MKWLITLVTRVTVDHAGLTEPPKLSMTECALRMVSRLFCPLLTLLHAADSWAASHKDAMEDKSELHGTGSRAPELWLAVTNRILLHAIHTPCLSVHTTLLQPLFLTVLRLPRLILSATRLALVTNQSFNLLTRNTQLHHTVSQVFKLCKLNWWPMVLLQLHSLFMKTSSATRLECKNTLLDPNWEDTQSKWLDGELRTEKTTG
jgi:hypothetical protein